MKHHPDISDLLNRYWEGETTLEEERWLKDFFATQPVPEQYRQEAALFRALRSEQSVQMPTGGKMAVSPRSSFRFAWAAAASVALLIVAGIWWGVNRPDSAHSEVAQELPAAKPDQEFILQVPAKSEAVAETLRAATPKAPKQHRFRPRLFHRQAEKVQQDTYEDPEKALAEIKAVLALVSNKINKSKKEIGKGLQEVEAVDILFKKKKETSG
jgi:hypothetical protein